MNEQSELGPIDPQMPVRLPNGDVTYSPAFLNIQQFQSLLASAVNNPNVGRVLAPYMQMYFPSFLQECKNAIEFIKGVAEKLLTDYMFKDDPDGAQKAENAAKILSDFSLFLSHGRSINIDYAKNDLKLNVFDTRTDDKLDRIINYIYISIKETFNRNRAIIKLCENSRGHGTVKHIAR